VSRRPGHIAPCTPGLACQFAGVIMAQMTTMVADSGLVYGDGTDISVHFLFVVLGPFCAFAVFRAAPMFLGMVLGTGGGGGGGAAFALAAAAGYRASGTIRSGHGGRSGDDAIVRAEADRIMAGSAGEQASSRLGDEQVDVANLRGE
jgi:hypothetical protein